MPVKPIRPDEARKKKATVIPDAVIEIFNELIVKNLSGNRAVIRQDDVVSLIVSRMDVTRADVFDKHWLDVEAIYEEAGWKVEYDKPGFNETYPATFTFKRK